MRLGSLTFDGITLGSTSVSSSQKRWVDEKKVCVPLLVSIDPHPVSPSNCRAPYLAVLNVLVNNSGATWGESLETYPDQAFTKLMTLNVQRVFTLCQKLVPMLRKGAENGGVGRIINVSVSAATRRGRWFREVPLITGSASS